MVSVDHNAVARISKISPKRRQFMTILFHESVVVNVRLSSVITANYEISLNYAILYSDYVTSHVETADNRCSFLNISITT